MTDAPPGMNAFELSRAYGEGWKAAKKLLASSTGDVDPGDVSARNPHCTPEMRARWTQGFVEGVGSPVPATARWGGNAWRGKAR